MALVSAMAYSTEMIHDVRDARIASAVVSSNSSDEVSIISRARTMITYEVANARFS